MADFLDEKLKEIDARLKELRPLVEEFNRLESARTALSGVTSESAGSGSTSSGRRRGPGRPRGSSSGRRGRPRGGNTRAKEALELVRARPGITIRELAEAMSIQPNYLYRILPQLEQEGQVKREDKGWSAAGGADGVEGADG
jgi:predicted Rossmann fold nucleotide-binding protein DprA/Smf involved in DNA uptake